jgi:TPP-dependent pyruvate/acetoin dehydrogenase alpha subunit
MKRYRAFDPPEYLHWEPDPALAQEYEQCLTRSPDRVELLGQLNDIALRYIYRDLLRTRLHDVALKRWVRTGVLSKAWLGTGEEAVTVGCVAALDRDRDVVTPMIRNAGALHMMGMPLADMLRGYLATADSPTGGRDLHIGDRSRGVIQPTSVMGTSICILAGVALSFRMRGEKRVAMTWVGDGATRTAAFHEGINFAATSGAPLVIVVQNNQVALGTRLDQHGVGDLSKIAEAYGLPSWKCDGNNVLDTYAAAKLAADRCRAGEGPAVVVAETFRMGGHATHDEREARETFSPELFAQWGRRCPVGQYESYLLARGFSPRLLEDIEQGVTDEMNEAAEEALRSRDRVPSPEYALYPGFSDGDPLVGLRNRPI